MECRAASERDFAYDRSRGNNRPVAKQSPNYYVIDPSTSILHRSVDIFAMNTLLYNDGEMYNASMYDFYATHTYNMFDDNTTSSLNTLDIYQYEKMYQVTTFYLVILYILYGTISILAVMGNSLVMWIIATSKHMQNVTNIFIANLAVADIVIGLFSIPFQFQAALLQRWDLPEFMCPFCPFVQVLSVNVSVFTLTAIAIDRHRAILKPLSAKLSKVTAKRIITGIWIIAGSLATPTAIVNRVAQVEEYPYDRKHFKPFCKHDQIVSDETMLIYWIILVFLQYLTPLSIISCVYARMALKLWGNRAPGNAEDSRDATLMKNKLRVIKMLIIVVALFAICWLPLQTYNVTRYLYQGINEYKNIHYIFFFCDWLAMSNSCYNPFIYGIYNEKFRKEFQQRCPFKSRNWTNSPPIDNIEMDKTQSTRASIRYEWKRTVSGSYPAVSSFYKGIPVKESTNSFVGKHQTSTQKKKEIGHYIRNDHENHSSMSSNTSEELYVFSSRKHTQNPDSEELCL
ncbi:RYamide receptor [Ptiloglossa arizonensis]|uniref:RYamide receptor n=1 Tax=Ptiloglossa arizonensis TaxID=3350558 RepID=UPI003F9EF467